MGTINNITSQRQHQPSFLQQPPSHCKPNGNISLVFHRYDDYLLEDATHSHGDYDDVHTGLGWEMDSFWRPPRVPEQDHVWLDPHVLANPAIADIDGDGQAELVLAVSYFFDRDQYTGAVSNLAILQAVMSVIANTDNNQPAG